MSDIEPEFIYAYKGTDKFQRKRKGTIYALSDPDAKAQLQNNGVHVKSISKKFLANRLAGKKKPSLKDKLFFTVQLATSIKAGLPLDQALKLTANNATNMQLRTAVRQILFDIEAGATLQQAFETQGHIFDKYYTSLIGVGESSGNLEKILLNLADSLDKITAIRNKVKKAMTYPVIVLSFGMLVIVGLLIWVVPQFDDMFKSLGSDLPTFTQIIVNISNILSEYILVFIVLLIGIVFSYRYLVKNNLKFRRKHDEFVLSIPLIGTMNSQGLTARFSRSLATLYESGTPMTESLEQCAYAMNNTVYEELVHDINDSVSQGDRLGEAMRSTGGFSDLSNSMVEIGEETGQLHTMLNRVADTYETELDDTVETLTTLIEPFMIIFLAVMVGIVVVAIYLPIFSLGSAI